MSDHSATLWLILASALTFKAMVLFSLSLKAHWKQVLSAVRNSTAGKPHSQRLKACGWLLLVLSGAACLRADHASMAVLVWILLISAAAFIVAMILAYRPSWLRLFALPIFVRR